MSKVIHFQYLFVFFNPIPQCILKLWLKTGYKYIITILICSNCCFDININNEDFLNIFFLFELDDLKIKKMSIELC